MATLSVQNFDEAGNDLTLSAAASGGDQFANTGVEMLVILNSDSSPKTVTIVAQNTAFTDKEYGLSVKQNQAIAVAANGGVAIIGPFSRRAFDDGSQNVQITYSAVTSLEVAVVKQI